MIFSSLSIHLVVVLHGLFRSKDSFDVMARALEDAGYEVAAVNYPSTRRSLEEHPRQVSTILDRAQGFSTVSFLTHSLGGIVTRQLLSLDAPWRKRIKLGRLVMIAPPSRGGDLREAFSGEPSAANDLGFGLSQLAEHAFDRLLTLKPGFGAAFAGPSV